MNSIPVSSSYAHKGILEGTEVQRGEEGMFGVTREGLVREVTCYGDRPLIGEDVAS